MQDSPSGSKGSSVLTKLLYNSTWRGWLFQGLVLLGLVSFFMWIISNTVTNLQRLDKKTGFGFLDEKAGFEILTSPGTSFMGYAPGISTYMDVFWVGVTNTIAVAAVGLIAATVLGFLMGIMRLSKNKILSSIPTVYVEIFRNIPLLLQILFWYSVMIKTLPSKRDQLAIFGDLGGLNKTGLYMPQPIFENGFGFVTIAFLVGLAACWLYGKMATGIQHRTGKRPVGWPVYLLLLIGIPIAVIRITTTQ